MLKIDGGGGVVVVVVVIVVVGGGVVVVGGGVVVVGGGVVVVEVKGGTVSPAAQGAINSPTSGTSSPSTTCPLIITLK
jgi:hypothetical protein